MTYDYDDPGWSNTVGHLAPLYGPSWSIYNVNATVHFWLAAGANRSKLVMGTLSPCNALFAMATLHSTGVFPCHPS